MPKVKKAGAKPVRHNPLADQIMDHEDSVNLRRTPRDKARRKPGGDDDEEAGTLPAAMSRKVLLMAQAQKTEGDALDAAMMEDEELGYGRTSTVGSAAGDINMSDVEVDDEGYIVMEGATEEDERAMSLFLPEGGGAGSSTRPGQTLADVILQKIQEHEQKRGGGDAQTKESVTQGISPKVIQVYSDIGKWLKSYKSGKLPKAFKVIPSLQNWEEVLSLTNPLSWSPAAMYEAVNIFASNLNPRMAQRFFNLVLLPAVRQDIAEHKKLNFHYYRALRKAIFKPAAFFKGIVLPMAAEQCTLREAVILSSVLAKTSIPAMHVAATLVRLCSMTPWYGTTSIILATLLNKKYSLPVQVIEHLVSHFAVFASDYRVLPVVWHRALLVFVQRYKFDLDEDQRKRIRELLKVHFHESVGAETRRELFAPKPGEVVEPSAAEARMDVS